jgi:hypothetical protein
MARKRKAERFGIASHRLYKALADLELIPKI